MTRVFKHTMYETEKIARREWATAVLTTLLLILLLAIPYWLAYTRTPFGQTFTGTLMNPEDSQTYLAKIWQGYNGRFLYTIPFTPEPHQPAFVGVFYVWLGQAARVAGMSVTAVWHTSRIIAQAILSLTTFWFVAQFTSGRIQRWTACLLALFGSGLGWMLFLFGQTYWLEAFPVDFKQPGAHLFFTALTFPHIALGTALIMISVWALWRMGERPSIPLAIFTGFIHVALGIAYPFLLYLVALVALLLFLSRWNAEWHEDNKVVFPFPLFWQYAIAFLVPLPLYLYYAYTLHVNDVFRAWDVQAATPSAPWPHYLLAYGLMLLLGGLYGWRRPAARSATAVLWIWVLAAAMLLYAPLNPQRRFVQGVQVPLAILASAGFVDVLLLRLSRSQPWQKLTSNPRYSTEGMYRLLIAGFLLFMSLSNVYVLTSVSVSAVVQQPDPLFRPIDELEAVAWLRENVSETAVVLAAYESGNYIAGQGGPHVVLGHWAETVDYDTKTAAIADFFSGTTSDTCRQTTLQTYHVDYLWYGPRERALGSFLPERASYLRPIYQNDTITVYAMNN